MSARQIGSLKETPEASRHEKCLRELYCEYFQCQPEEFAKELSLNCFHSIYLARLLWHFDPEIFRDDMELLDLLGRTTSLSECRQELEAFRHANPPAGLLRRRLKVRVSGQAVLDLAAKLFAQERPAQR